MEGIEEELTQDDVRKIFVGLLAQQAVFVLVRVAQHGDVVFGFAVGEFGGVLKIIAHLTE